jgi:hypothetical protein
MSPSSTAVQAHAAATEFAEVDIVAAFGAGEQGVAGEAGGGGGECLAGEGVDAVLGAVFGGFEHPVDEVVAAVSAGCFGAGVPDVVASLRALRGKRENIQVIGSLHFV